MADEGTRLTDKAVSQVERRIRKVYKEAERDIAKKMSEFTAKHAAKDAQMRAKLAAGEITQEQYQRWQRGQVFIGKQWEAKRDSIADTLYHANQAAQAIVNEQARGVFATNFNYQNFELEKTAGIEMGFGLYENATVGRLIRERPRLLPQPKVSKPKDVKWNQRNIANSITQSIIQGESIPEAAKRLAQTTGSTNMNAMRMHTRTALTGAQNAGRIEAMHEQQEMGIEVKKKWIATLDDRTRDTHAQLDGQVVDVDEPFRVDGMEIMEPGDPSAPPELVYNCRCSLGYVYPRYEHLVNHDRRAKNEDGEYEQVGDVTFKEWQEGKRGEAAQTERTTAAQKALESGYTKSTGFTDVFNQEQKSATMDTIKTAEEEYPLPYEFDFVGDGRIPRNLPNETLWDLRDEYPERRSEFGEAAQYVSVKKPDGTIERRIDIINDDMQSVPLQEMFDELYRVHKEFEEEPDLSHALYNAGVGLEGTVLHEYGHAVQDACGFFIRSTPEGADFERWIRDYSYSNPKGILSISRYAGEGLSVSNPSMRGVNTSEVWAEAFVTSFDPHHDTLAWQTANDIMTEFRKRFGHIFKRR